MTVQIYTTPTCAYCKMAKGYFKEKGVEYKEYDVSQDREKLHEMIEKSGGTSVPVIDINGKIILGFDQIAIDEALK